MDYNLPDTSVHGILQARIVKWVAISSFGDLPGPGIEPVSPAPPALQADSFIWAIREGIMAHFWGQVISNND